MGKYDEITEVTIAKGIDTIEHVEKFNPFHDARGRFASSNGFKSYSANPNTKAGAMAISRSAAAGHGKTVNVHRQSYGENIRQNANWIGRGHQSSPRQQGNATLRNRIEPTSGLRGASAAGARWQGRNAAQGRTTNGPAKPKATQAAKPAQKPSTSTSSVKPAQSTATNQASTKPSSQNTSSSLKSETAGVNLPTSAKHSLLLRDAYGHTTTNTKKVSNDTVQKRVDGKDISKTFDANKIKGNGSAIDKVARAQGWNTSATVTNDLETFQKMAVKSGRVMFRSVNGSSNISDDEMCRRTMTDGNFSPGGNGGKMYGGGMYLTDCKFNPTDNLKKNVSRVSRSQQESYGYAFTQMMATVRSDAKIADSKTANSLVKEFQSLSAKDRQKFGWDHGAYIASKGYDGAKWFPDQNPGAYTTVYNKSALVFYGTVAKYT